MDLNLLKKLISINSVYPNELKLTEFLEDYLHGLGFSTERQYVSENRFNIFAERGSKSNSCLCFFGHMDTVPVYGDWDSDPFTAVEKDGKLFGLGSVDMKGGLFAILEACKNTNQEKYLKVVFCVDEENISLGAWNAVKNKDFFKDVSAIIAAETGNIHPFDENEKWVHLGRRGRCSIVVEVQGLSAHGAFPEKGINAITDASVIINSLESIIPTENIIIGKSSLYANNITSNETSLSIPDYCRFEINQSLVPPQTPETSLQEVANLIANLINSQSIKSKVKTFLAPRETPFAPPYVTDLNNPTIQAILEVLRISTPKVSIDYGLSVADENVFANNTNAAIISIGPEGDNEHTANEWVDLKSLERLIKYFEDIINKV